MMEQFMASLSPDQKRMWRMANAEIVTADPAPAIPARTGPHRVTRDEILAGTAKMPDSSGVMKPFGDDWKDFFRLVSWGDALKFDLLGIWGVKIVSGKPGKGKRPFCTHEPCKCRTSVGDSPGFGEKQFKHGGVSCCSECARYFGMYDNERALPESNYMLLHRVKMWEFIHFLWQPKHRRIRELIYGEMTQKSREQYERGYWHMIPDLGHCTEKTSGSNISELLHDPKRKPVLTQKEKEEFLEELLKEAKVPNHIGSSDRCFDTVVARPRGWIMYDPVTAKDYGDSMSYEELQESRHERNRSKQ